MGTGGDSGIIFVFGRLILSRLILPTETRGGGAGAGVPPFSPGW
jgi:hypothetical protein